MGSIVQKLTEGIVKRDLQRESHALLEKWEKTNLLVGLGDERSKQTMALLLENQAKQLLSEASSMAAGDVEGFAAVAFPLVRRVFGGLVANDLVSVQPMSLPSGLIFFLDFTYTDGKAGGGAVAGESIYGGDKVGGQLTGGVNLEALSVGNDLWSLEKSAYSLNNAYSTPTGSVTVAGTFVAMRSGSGVWAKSEGPLVKGDANYVNRGDELIRHDADLSGSIVAVYNVAKSSFTNLNVDNLVSIHTTSTGSMAGFALVRRLTRQDPLSGSNRLLLVFATHNSGSEDSSAANLAATPNWSGSAFTYAVQDSFTTGTGLGSVVGTTPWGLEFDTVNTSTGLNDDIREIDIKVDSIAVTAKSRKLKAKWTPELGQDLSAYHNLDAEVELTSILSEQIALEIDREILGDLVKGATAGVYHWSRRPGKFVNKTTGLDITSNGANLPDFTGNVSQWYETLVETINDVSAQIHRKTLRGGANFLVTSPEVANILEMTNGFRANVTADDNKGDVSVVKSGSVTKKWDLWVDPYFPRNVILVGRKGSSFLESGFAYCPYVPLQVTPTIFDTETFTPRRGVMTRYAKQMTRSDYYGLVIVVDLLG